MVLDEFVYDPDAQIGSLVINATKGVFRLVGGKISKKNSVLLKTPTATIGIRGGINYTVIGDNSLQTINGFGQTTVESEGVQHHHRPPGLWLDGGAGRAALAAGADRCGGDGGGIQLA